jgi:hypothetical protein
MVDAPMGSAHASLVVGWITMIGGVVSGSIIGLLFHHADWLGGYASFRRRLVRLAHISFFGIGFLNVLFGVTAAALPLDAGATRVGSTALMIAAVAMPANCLLTAWREPFRHLFFIPVLAVTVGILSVLFGWR